MLRNCFWHSYYKIEQEVLSVSHQKIESSSDNRLDDQVKINPNKTMRTKMPTLKKLIVDEIMV